MATQRDIEATYDRLGYFHALRTAEYKDYTCALFRGDFTKSLDQAQKDKHGWVLDGVGAGIGTRVLEVGCGWGPMLIAIQRRGGVGLGLTLSSDQFRYCKSRKLNVRLLDYKDADVCQLGGFDAVVSIGAFEHFCSIEDYLGGRQLGIYQQFFDFCAAVLPPRGRLYLQTMTWGKHVPDPALLTESAPQDSDNGVLYRLTKFYPGSWLPANKEAILAAAKHRFRCIYASNGRLDYIETINRWGHLNRNLYRPSCLLRHTLPAVVRLLPRYFVDRDFRTQVLSVRRNDQQECFLREIMSHERLFLEKL